MTEYETIIILQSNKRHLGQGRFVTCGPGITIWHRQPKSDEQTRQAMALGLYRRHYRIED